ncbi:MAG: TPM domain-containing protein [Halioglobus sp.]
MKRYLRNFFTTRFALKHAFPQLALDAIEAAIAHGETTHSGEIRFVIETALDLPALVRGVRPRDRALELFAGLGVWDTAMNNGVLIYVLLAERMIEIVADRGYDNLVSADEWQAVCETMRSDFKHDRFRNGALAGVASVSTLIGRHFPPAANDVNELANRPTIL